MSAVAAIDLSTKALDIVTIDVDTLESDWTRIPLQGGNAWDRTLALRDAMPPAHLWDDVALVCIEAPYGRGQAGTNALLNRVVGAVAASLPHHLRKPDRCWIVRPDEWKTGLNLTGKPSALDLGPHGYQGFDTRNTDATLAGDQQDARDAWALAYWTLRQLDQQAAA